MRIELTEHAVERARQRLGWSEGALARMTDRVLYFGLGAAQTTGALRRYLQQRERDDGVIARSYGEHIFVFRRTPAPEVMLLVTVFQLPRGLRRTIRRPRAQACAA